MSVWWRASPLPASISHLGTVCYSDEASSPGKGAHRFRVPDFQRTKQTLQSPQENEGFLTGSGCGEGGVNQRRVFEEVLPEMWVRREVGEKHWAEGKAPVRAWTGEATGHLRFGGLEREV